MTSHVDLEARIAALEVKVQNLYDLLLLHVGPLGMQTPKEEEEEESHD